MSADTTENQEAAQPPVVAVLVDSRHLSDCQAWHAAPPWDCTCGLVVRCPICHESGGHSLSCPSRWYS